MPKTFSLDSFKEAINIDKNFKDSILENIGADMDKHAGADTFDPDNGVAIIHEKNLMAYLEKFMCKNKEELSDFLYYKKGIFLKII